jgi:predicted nucleic acid-binding Zn ribbon protein
VKDASRIGELLHRALRGSPLAEGIQRQQALEIWPDVVGAAIAAHSEAVSLDHGVLCVRVDGSVWAQELTMLQAQIKAAFAERLGDGAVTNIRFTSGGH